MSTREPRSVACPPPRDGRGGPSPQFNTMCFQIVVNTKPELTRIADEVQGAVRVASRVCAHCSRHGAARGAAPFRRRVRRPLARLEASALVMGTDSNDQAAASATSNSQTAAAPASSTQPALSPCLTPRKRHRHFLAPCPLRLHRTRQQELQSVLLPLHVDMEVFDQLLEIVSEASVVLRLGSRGPR
jgi:hypothetical protein